MISSFLSIAATLSCLVSLFIYFLSRQSCLLSRKSSSDILISFYRDNFVMPCLIVKLFSIAKELSFVTIEFI